MLQINKTGNEYLFFITCNFLTRTNNKSKARDLKISFNIPVSNFKDL